MNNHDVARQVHDLVLKTLAEKDRETEELRWRFDQLKEAHQELKRQLADLNNVVFSEQDEEWLLHALRARFHEVKEALPIIQKLEVRHHARQEAHRHRD